MTDLKHMQLQGPGHNQPPPYGSQQPVILQPGQIGNPYSGMGQQQWMNVPQNQNPGCPPGLEYLTMVDQVLCHQVVEMLEAFTGWETNNKYVVKNSLGQQIFYVFEETDMCMRQCCHNQRGYTLHVVNNYNQEVMKISRPFKCCAGCCWCAAIDCCAHETLIEAPPGNVIGQVRQTAAGCTFNYAIQDADGKSHLFIKGPCLMCRCCSDVEFPVYNHGDQQVGCVTKQWSGVVREMFTDADNFGITFPMDLDVKLKATMMGALFLIDFMAFEDNDRKNH